MRDTFVVDLLAHAKSPVFFTGAGISVDAGLFTYRGSGGLWTKDPDAEALSAPPPAGLSFDETLAWWDRLWTRWSQWRRLLAHIDPSDLHLAIAERVQCGGSIITQNIDGLHAGVGEGVYELHGSLLRSRCSRRGCSRTAVFDDCAYDTVPLCDRCGRVLRADVVLFSESVDGRVFDAATRSANASDALFVVGTSGVVSPANEIILTAASRNVPLVYVGPDPWEGPAVSFAAVLPITAAEFTSYFS